MNAETTAYRVLIWAITVTGPAPADGEDPATPPLPSGPLRAARALAQPAEETITALAELARRTAARLGAGAPPFGDPSPIGLGGLLLAAAIGGRAQPGPARLIAEAVAAPRLTSAARSTAGWSDALARHALVAATLTDTKAAGTKAAGTEAEPLLETLLRCSPLTAVLHRPAATTLAAEATAAEVDTALGLLARPRGAAVLHAALSRWSPDPAVLRWRADLLTRLAHPHPEFVIDTYVTARLRHGAEWDRHIRDAARTLSRVGRPDELSLATARYWLPLSALRRRDPDLLRARPLLAGYQYAVRLVEGRHRVSIAGAA